MVPIAQSAERLTVDHEVTGSSPVRHPQETARNWAERRWIDRSSGVFVCFGRESTDGKERGPTVAGPLSPFRYAEKLRSGFDRYRVRLLTELRSVAAHRIRAESCIGRHRNIDIRAAGVGGDDGRNRHPGSVHQPANPHRLLLAVSALDWLPQSSGIPLRLQWADTRCSSGRCRRTRTRFHPEIRT